MSKIGTQITVKFLGKPVFIRRRTEKEIELARAVDVADLPDGNARNSNESAEASAIDANRTLSPFGGNGADLPPGAVAGEWLVMMGVCTHLGCVPLGDGAGDFDGWFCPCHGSHYDTSGRIRKGPAPENLPIPFAAFVDDTTIELG